MPVEEGEFISDFVPTNPPKQDFKSEGPNHFWLIKQWIQNTFPNINGEVTATKEQINSGGVLIGSIVDYAGINEPDGWMFLDARELDILEFEELYAAIGDVWNETAGAALPVEGFFRIPPGEVDGFGLYTRNKGDLNEVGDYDVDIFKSHNHSIVAVQSSNSGGAGSSVRHVSAGNVTGSTGGAETRPRTITMNKIIKVKNI